MKRKFSALLAAIGLAAATTAGCASGNSESGNSGGSSSSAKTITIGYINWDEDVAVSHLWKKILEDKGYTVKLQSIPDAGPTFVGLSKGNIDLFLDGWLPMTHKEYVDKYKNQITDISTWYDNAALSIAVPNYVKINSLSELNKIGPQVGNTITGIEPGAGLTEATNQMLKDYGLKGWKQQTSSTAAMLAALKKATAEKKPIVVALWHPHWAYKAFPIKDLQDPKGAMGKAEKIHAMGSKNFPKDFPEVDKMLKKFKMSDQQLASLENDVLQENKDNPAKGVQQWLKANPSFVKSLG